MSWILCLGVVDLKPTRRSHEYLLWLISIRRGINGRRVPTRLALFRFLLTLSLYFPTLLGSLKLLERALKLQDEEEEDVLVVSSLPPHTNYRREPGVFYRARSLKPAQTDFTSQ